MNPSDARTFSGLNAILESPKWPLAKQCQAVEDCIAFNRDNLRGFFEACFPTLLRRLFGYDGSSWLTAVAKGGKEADANALLKLLSPTGVLFNACYAADADGLIRFVFPTERLPTHTQMMLAAAGGRTELEGWPQYAGALVYDATGKPHIHLGVLQYLVFWTAFYVLKGGDGGGIEATIRSRPAGLSDSVRKAADVLHLTRGRESEVMKHPYMALLRQFLLDLLPRPASAAQAAAAGSPVKGGAPFFRGGGAQRSGGGEGATPRGLLFYSTLLEFWLTDGDEPVPLANTGDFANRTPAAPQTALAPMWSTTYEPPSEDLLEALNELVKYATCVDGTPVQPAQGAVSWLPLAPVHTVLPQQSRALSHLAGPPRLGAAAQPPAQAFGRRLFRFFHRAFTMWPDQRSIKPMLRPFLAYLAPWRTVSAAPALAAGGFAVAPGHSQLTAHLTAHVSDLVHRVHWAEGGRGGQDGGQGRYRREWESHVLCNLPFYTLLLPLFLEMCVSRLEVRGESAAQDLVNVLSVLEDAPELRDLLGRLEKDYNKYIASQPRRADGPFAELLPWVAEQAYDWEVAATVNVMGDAPQLRSAPGFCLMTAGGAAAAGAAAAGGETTAGGSAALTARELLHICSHLLKPEVHQRVKACLETALPLGQLPAEEDAAAAQAAAVEAAQYTEVLPRLPRSTWRDVRYKGDPLCRPIASYELGLLVRLLVALSRRLNAWLALDRPWSPEEDPPENRVQEYLVRLRRRGSRVNLRPLADLRNLAWLPICWLLVYYIYRGVAFVVWAFMVAVPQADVAFAGAGGGRDAAAQQAAHQRYVQQRQQHEWGGGAQGHHHQHHSL